VIRDAAAHYTRCIGIEVERKVKNGGCRAADDDELVSFFVSGAGGEWPSHL
jgi:hypothetical protein